jgi:benzoyl-CoA reductase/2-hydroxyglutaryl-CoA dehydratase subunit BcrC/BadD/HgdB
MRTIKTYANGRFYDTLNKGYMSKDQLAALINKKEAIKIIMHKTGRDVTQSVLKKMAAVANPKKESMLKIDNLRKWVSDQVDRRIEKAIQLINLPTKGQINRLTADIETLTKQVDGLQDRLIKTKPPVEPPQPDPAETVSQQA